jgi:hypothetical protein
MRNAETVLAIIRERGKEGHCHTAIHAGRPTRTRKSLEAKIEDQGPLESRVL